MLSKMIMSNNLARWSLSSVTSSLTQLRNRKELSSDRNELVAFKGKTNSRDNRFQTSNRTHTRKQNHKNYEKNFIFKGKSNECIEKLNDDQDLNEKPEFEEDLELYSTNKNLYHKKVIDEDIRQRKSFKYGIIKKKMKILEEGKGHTYMNLLSWDAKEQIKHLNLNDPDYWTVVKICESFPITLESCKKLLKSKWVPKTLDDLAKHDEKVIENWKKLTAIENTEPSGPAINIYEEYKKSNRLALLKNACGLPDVEFDRKALIFTDSFSIHETVLCMPGTFSNLIARDIESMEKIFNKNKTTQQSDSTVTKSKSSSSVEDHLKQTRQELAKSLEKLTLDIKDIK